MTSPAMVEAVLFLLGREQVLAEPQRLGDAGVREWASLAMLDAIGFAEELEMRRGWRGWEASVSRPAH